MKKIFIFFCSILIAVSWYLNINSEVTIINKSKNYLQIANNYFDKGLYIDAIDYYNLSYEINQENETKEKIYETYLKLNEFDKAFNYLKMLKDKKTNKQKEFLNHLLSIEEYSKYNYFLNLVDKEVQNEFKSNNYFLYKDLEISFDDIKFNPNNDTIFAKLGDNWNVINNRGKATTPKYLDILYKDGGMLTVNDKNLIKVIDKANNIRSNITVNNVLGFKDGFMVQNKDSKQSYIDRTNKEVSQSYGKASNFSGNTAVVFDDKNYLINKIFENKKELEGGGFKVNKFNDAIIDNKVIVKIDKKFKIYDLINDKYSASYDDIDFSYGEFIAVKKKSKWGYINQEFEEIILPKYDYAESFSAGIAIVKNKRKYFMIDENGNEHKIGNKPIKTFNNEGISFIKKDSKWNMIKLVRYIND